MNVFLRSGFWPWDNLPHSCFDVIRKSHILFCFAMRCLPVLVVTSETNMYSHWTWAPVRDVMGSGKWYTWVVVAGSNARCDGKWTSKCVIQAWYLVLCIRCEEKRWCFWWSSRSFYKVFGVWQLSETCTHYDAMKDVGSYSCCKKGTVVVLEQAPLRVYRVRLRLLCL